MSCVKELSSSCSWKKWKSFKAQAHKEAERKVYKSKLVTSGRSRDFPKSPRFTRYTPLIADRSRILEKAFNANPMTTPKRTTMLPNADQMQHCCYHHNFSHTTEDCWALKDKIEELVQAGHLHRFVQSIQEDWSLRTDKGRTWDHCEERSRIDGQERREGRNRQDVAPVGGVINTIIGGFARGGTTSSSWRDIFELSARYNPFIEEDEEVCHLSSSLMPTSELLNQRMMIRWWWPMKWPILWSWKRW